jgi:hypothetical protein
MISSGISGRVWLLGLHARLSPPHEAIDEPGRRLTASLESVGHAGRDVPHGSGGHSRLAGDAPDCLVDFFLPQGLLLLGLDLLLRGAQLKHGRRVPYLQSLESLGRPCHGGLEPNLLFELRHRLQPVPRHSSLPRSSDPHLLAAPSAAALASRSLSAPRRSCEAP